MNPRIIALTFFLTLIPSVMFSAEPTVSAGLTAPEVVLGDSVQYVIESSVQLKGLKAPQTEGLEIQYAGEGRNSSVTIINGQMKSENTYRYTFFISARQTGTFTIGAFEFSADGKQMKTEPVRLKAVKGQPAPKRRGGGIFGMLEDYINQNTPRVPTIFVKLEPSRAKIYQNQQFILDVVLYSSDQQALDYQYAEAAPIRSGKLAMTDLTSSLSSTTSRSGPYYKKILKRYAVFPIEAARIGIEPPALVGITPYGQMQIRRETIGIESLPFKSDNGISYIGQLSGKAVLSTNTVEQGKSAQLVLTLKGTGNIKGLSNPYSGFQTEGLVLSQPSVETSFVEWNRQEAVFQSVIRYNILAQKAGQYSIPPLNLRYYDEGLTPRTLSVPAFLLTVQEGRILEGFTGGATRPDSRPQPVALVVNPFYLLLMLLTLLVPPAALVYTRHRTRLMTDETYARKFLHRERAKTLWAQAEEYLKTGQLKEYYSTLQKTVIQTLAARYGLKKGCGQTELISYLEKRNHPEELNELKQLLSMLAARSYGLGHSSPVNREQAVDVLLSAQKAVEFWCRK